MTNLFTDCVLIAAALVVIGMCLYVLWEFSRKPREEQIEAVKQWLIGACYDAEVYFSESGMGVLKLRMVFDCFVARFPWVAKLVSFDTFHEWVKEALEKLPGVIADIEAKQNPKAVEAADE